MAKEFQTTSFILLSSYPSKSHHLIPLILRHWGRDSVIGMRGCVWTEGAPGPWPEQDPPGNDPGGMGFKNHTPIRVDYYLKLIFYSLDETPKLVAQKWQ